MFQFGRDLFQWQPLQSNRQLQIFHILERIDDLRWNFRQIGRWMQFHLDYGGGVRDILKCNTSGRRNNRPFTHTTRRRIWIQWRWTAITFDTCHRIRVHWQRPNAHHDYGSEMHIYLSLSLPLTRFSVRYIFPLDKQFQSFWLNSRFFTTSSHHHIITLYLSWTLFISNSWREHFFFFTNASTIQPNKQIVII